MPRRRYAPAVEPLEGRASLSSLVSFKLVAPAKSHAIVARQAPPLEFPGGPLLYLQHPFFPYHYGPTEGLQDYVNWIPHMNPLSYQQNPFTGYFFACPCPTSPIDPVP